jgi:negative regulator of sigma E activity
MNQANQVFGTSPTTVLVSQLSAVPRQEILSRAAPIDPMDKMKSSQGATNFKVENWKKFRKNNDSTRYQHTRYEYMKDLYKQLPSPDTFRYSE